MSPQKLFVCYHLPTRDEQEYIMPVSGPSRAPPTPPFRLFILHLGKTLNADQKSTKSSDAAVIAEPISGGSGALPGTLPEGEITAGGLLHHHVCLRNDAYMVKDSAGQLNPLSLMR